MWESSRVSVNHTLVVHLAQAKSHNFSAALDYYDARLGAGRAPLIGPRLRCAPTSWTHLAARRWQECVNVAQCLDSRMTLSPPPPPPPPPHPPPLPASETTGRGAPQVRRRVPPPREGWVPAAVRETCKMWRREQLSSRGA